MANVGVAPAANVAVAGANVVPAANVAVPAEVCEGPNCKIGAHIIPTAPIACVNGWSGDDCEIPPQNWPCSKFNYDQEGLHGDAFYACKRSTAAPACADGYVLHEGMNLEGYEGFYCVKENPGPREKKAINQLAQAMGTCFSAGKVRSEATGRCISIPWDDFKTCEEEARQGACDDNPWVQKHCVNTCKL